jgi:hypothetical protein
MEESRALTTRKRRAKRVPQQDGKADPETLARAANEEPLEPLPGMVKRQCPVCRYLFAVDVAMAEEAPLCPAATI